MEFHDAFYDACEVNLSEKAFDRSTAYSCRTNCFIKFNRFLKNESTQLKTKQRKQNIFKTMVIWYGKLLW